MDRIFTKYPWLKSVGCGVLVVALVLSICLPLMGMRSAEPDNPILQAEPQEITVLQAGKAPGGAGSGDGVETSGSGANGDTESDLTGDFEQPDPNEADNEAGQDAEPETAPQDQPTQPDYSEASIGTNTDSNQSNDGEEAGETGETDEDLPLAPLDLGAALTWYKYGSEPTSIVCAPGQSVGKRVLLAQLDNGSLPYSLDLTGLDAQDAAITGAFFASGNEIEIPIDTRGAVPMSLPDGAEYQNYVFIVQAHATQKNQKGETVETDVQFTFILRLESGIDLDLQMSWQALTAPAQATCFANSSVSRTIKGDTIQDGLFQYDFTFLGESAREAEFISADYRATDGETGVLTQSGTLQMAPADGQDTETYSITVTARVSGQTIRYNFVLTYEDGLDLQLQFTWYKKPVTAQNLLCDADKRVNLTIKHNQLDNGLLDYRFALKGKSASDAQILSATIDGTALNTEKGSYQLQSSESGTTYTILVTADVKGKPVTFTVTLRYQSDVSLQMSYTITEDGTAKPCVLTCENSKTVNANPIYDDQLADGLLTYQFSIQGEDAANVTVSSVKCYQTGGDGNSLTLTAPDGSITLLLREKKTGNNLFTVAASSADGTNYEFKFNLPYKHRGDKEVKIKINLDDGMTVTNDTDVNLNVEAWTEDEATGQRTYILASGTDTELTVTLDGETVRSSGMSGTIQQYVLRPKNPETGDKLVHTLKIYAEDAYGNSNTLEIKLNGERVQKGQKIGEAQIYIDLSVVGLGTYGPVSYDVLADEPVSYVVLKAILGRDMGEPFGTAKTSLGWATCDYSGTTPETGFYLRALDDGNNLGNRAEALSGDWSSYGADAASVYTAIDQYFQGSAHKEEKAALWRCIYNNKIPLTPASGILGEQAFTIYSGWLYSIGGETFYPGTSMSNWRLKDHDTLVLRYTLACGWDVGATMASEGKGSAGYCAGCTNGTWWVNHTFQKQKDGTYACTACGLIQDCPHTNSHWKDLGDGTCIQICDDENGKEIGAAKAHEFGSYTADPENENQHVRTCKNCGAKEIGEHRWPSTTAQAKCEEDVTLTLTCEDCGATKEETIPAAGHEADLGSWHKDANGHWHICVRCQKELPETKASHQYALLYGTWRCTDCFAKHSEACTGEVKATSLNETSHQWSCTSCNAVSVVEEHHFDESGVCTDCGHTKAPDIPEHDCAANLKDLHDNGDGSTHTGTCSVCGKSVTAVHTFHYTPNDEHTHTATCSICAASAAQEHDMVNGSCALCYYTPIGPTEPTDPEGEYTDE